MLERKTYFAGVDIGSTTMKVIVMANDGSVVFNCYERHNANPNFVGQQIATKIQKAMGFIDLHLMLTGSVGMGFAERYGLPFTQEVIAAAKVIETEYPECHTFVDMGGEDSKMIFFEKNHVPDMRMNGNCAGGTGAFIDQTATLLGVQTSELNDMAAQATTIHPIASRCGVFSKTDIQNLLSRNVSKADIAASMLNAVSMQVVSALARGMQTKPLAVLCGGPFAYIPELKKHLQRVMGLSDDDCVVPDNAQYLPAMGCAIAARESDDTKAYHIEDIIKRLEQPEQIVLHSSLQPLFNDQEEYNKWLQARVKVQPILDSKKPIDTEEKYFLGVDSGSTTTKLVLLNTKGQIVYTDYSYNQGDSLSAFAAAVERMTLRTGDVNIAASCATGYGEQLLCTAFSLDYGIVETLAHYRAAVTADPEVSFILDIGGQDMKAIFVNNQSIQRIEINEACSSGCGSFIMTFAKQLQYDISDFARMACFARHPYDLGTRCTVFMNSKVKQAMREGAGVDDIAAGFAYSVVKNCLFKVLRLQSTEELGKHIVVQGGTMKNHAVVRTLEKETGCQVSFTNIPELMGAYGAALYALQQG